MEKMVALVYEKFDIARKQIDLHVEDEMELRELKEIENKIKHSKN